MQMKCTKKWIRWFFLTAFIVVMTLGVTGCGQKTEAKPVSQIVIETDGQAIGTGETEFELTVADAEGSEIRAVIHTDEKTVGAALKALGLISGEESATGLYVKTVSGITADFEKDGIYWAFYVNGEYAQTGVDSTEIRNGESYAFRVEKA